MSPAVTVLTTTWNRGSYLERVWEGLNKQTSMDFEWIVADDGSTDDTADRVAALASRSDFSIIYLRAEAHVGKARMDNEAISRASGELTIWCDSDDVLMPSAVERFIATWRSIKNQDRFLGVTALATTGTDIIATPSHVPDAGMPWNEMINTMPGGSDMTIAIRTSAVKAHPFPDVDLVIPESSVWAVIGHQLVLFIPEALKLVEYGCQNAISFSGVMSYNRGRATSLAISHRESSIRRALIPSSFKTLVKFLRYSWHGEIGYKEAFDLWDHGSWLRFASGIPVAALYVVYDLMFNTIVKSHREHSLNRGASVECRSWPIRQRASN